MGRPRTVDWDEINRLAERGQPPREIASRVGCSYDTVCQITRESGTRSVFRRGPAKKRKVTKDEIIANLEARVLKLERTIEHIRYVIAQTKTGPLS